MERGDLVIVDGSPMDEDNLFGYINGDIGICIGHSIDGQPRTVLIWFDEDKKYWIPELWVKKMGE
jgi:hypothetical protein